MLFLENINMEVLVLFAGMIEDVNILAAQVILVAVTQFSGFVAYSFSLAAMSMVGHALGANKPKLAVANCKLVILVTTSFNIIASVALIVCKSVIVHLFTGDPKVIELAEASFPVMVISLAFDW